MQQPPVVEVQRVPHPQLEGPPARPLRNLLVEGVVTAVEAALRLGPAGHTLRGPVVVIEAHLLDLSFPLLKPLAHRLQTDHWPLRSEVHAGL